MKILTLIAIFACLTSDEQIPRGTAPNITTPILVELFTSEGCSNCSLADAWLQTLDISQPIPGAQAIVLSEHVDYFDHKGWKDSYSSPLFTDRQSGYVRALKLSTAYTPQVVVDGDTELRLNDARQMIQVLQSAAKVPQVPVSIGAMSFDGKTPVVLRTHIEADGTSQRRNADVYAAIAIDHAESQVLHGENAGRRLTHVAVVQELIKIGRLEKGRSFSKDFQAKLKPGMDPLNFRLIVFVQEPDLGNVLGAALQEAKPSNK
jgi:hypothetical protein